jgi:UDP-2-acetamido-3-amino-2,3-dideoxy-glucuronate N-acetyltransferase
MSAKPYFAHGTAILDGETEANGRCDPNIGPGTHIWHHAHVMAGARLGAGCNLGQNVFVGADVVMGIGCKLQNNVNVYDGVVMEDHVFCGPSMTFTNLSSPLPRAAIARRGSYQRTIVRKDASIGAGAVIVCGHELGEACFVAAGAVVVRDVPPFALVAGNPARVIGWVCRCGGRLHFTDSEATCTQPLLRDGRETPCGLRYRKTWADRIEPVLS